ncbi:hypothetical protein [uncultured Jatrophihabitans sp.]|uniref:hypothetical protein n=1 Tax=uncultured Jatrophihabitans sp. TaxID=1610747 RepID=UPI0035CAB0CA
MTPAAAFAKITQQLDVNENVVTWSAARLRKQDARGRAAESLAGAAALTRERVLFAGSAGDDESFLSIPLDSVASVGLRTTRRDRFTVIALERGPEHHLDLPTSFYAALTP